MNNLWVTFQSKQVIYIFQVRGKDLWFYLTSRLLVTLRILCVCGCSHFIFKMRHKLLFVLLIFYLLMYFLIGIVTGQIVTVQMPFKEENRIKIIKILLELKLIN